MGRTNTGSSVSSDGFYRIFFVGLKPNMGPGDLAEKLVNLRLFEDISVENHRNGYVAKVKFFPGCEPKRPSEYISKNIGEEFGKVVRA